MDRREILKVLGLLPLASILGADSSAMSETDRNAFSPMRLSGKNKLTGALPELFVLGDSISIHYGLYLQQFVDGIATYGRKQEETINATKVGSNGGNSKIVLDYLKLKFSDRSFNPDYILINCGLHDIKRAGPAYEFQVCIKDYKKNLKEVFSLLKKRNINIVWVRITPVVDAIHNSRRADFKRYAADVKAYNGVADQLCAERSIPVIDLFTFTSLLPGSPENKYIDNVHFNEGTRVLQASYIAGFLQSHLKAYSMNH